MAVDIALKATVELGEGAKSLKTLKQEFKETQKQLEGLTVGSEKYIKTLKKLGAVKDDIGDLNTTIKSFNPEGKIGALSSTIGGVASGFQAATAATALFGTENKELEKTLLKVQASMAFADGIKGVVAMGDAFKVLNAIILANPITAIVVGLAALVAGIYAFAKSNDVAQKSQKELNDETERGIALIEKNADSRRKNQEVFIDAKQRELDLLKAQGASAEAIYNKEKELIDLKQRLLSNVQYSRTKINKEEEKEQLDLANQKKILDAEYIKSEEDKLEKQKEINKKALDDKKQKDIDYVKWKQAIDEAYYVGREQAAIERFEAIAAAELKANTIVVEDNPEEADFERQTRLATELAMTKFKIESEWEEKKKTLAKESIQATQQLSDSVFAVRLAKVKKGSAEELKIQKQQFNINKAMQLSLATIDGFKAITASLASSPLAVGVLPNPTGIANLVLTAATTAANIARIASMQFGGGGGGGSVTAVSAPSTGSVPTVNAPTQQTTQLSPTGQVINPTEQNQPMRAYVVETEITQTQQNVGRIQQQATW